MTVRHFYILLVALLLPLTMQAQTRSGLHPERFDTLIAGQRVGLYVLRNKRGAEACITNYGARLVSLMMPDRRGRMDDVVLGFDNITQYHRIRQNFGATVGRYASRIAGACMVLDGDTVRFRADGKGNLSHGGYPGFADRVWTVVEQADDHLTLRYVSADGENGFPGELTTTLTYTLTRKNELRVSYEATTTRTTVVNFTHHSFFCLSGSGERSVSAQLLRIDADSIAELKPDKNVSGRFLSVSDTDFDFRQQRPIGSFAYDHPWQLRQGERCVELVDEESGRTLTVSTTEPAVLVYTANGLKNGTGKHGRPYGPRSAVCLESMHFADSPNQPAFPTTTLRPGQTFRSTTIYRFGIKKR